LNVKLMHIVYFNLALTELEPFAATIQATVNQDHRKNNHAQEHKKYPGKTVLNQGKNPTILCYILKRRFPTP